MTFSTRNFDPLTPLSPKFPNFAIQILLFRLKHTVAVVTHAHVLYQFLHHLGTGCCLPKTTFRTKIGGGWAEEHPKIWDPLRITATVKASNFKFGTQIGFGTIAYQKQRFGPKLAGVWAKGASKKSWDPLPIFATVEASDWKIGTQHEFRFTLPNASFR